jgi:hypothetical protein
MNNFMKICARNEISLFSRNQEIYNCLLTVFSFPVVDWFCLFIYLWVLTFPLLDCSEFGNFVITFIAYGQIYNCFLLSFLLQFGVCRVHPSSGNFNIFWQIFKCWLLQSLSSFNHWPIEPKRRNFFKCAPPNLKSWIRPWSVYHCMNKGYQK